MSLRLSLCCRGGLAVAACVWGGLAVPGVRAQDKPAVADPKSPPAVTRPAPVSARPPLPKNGLLRLEESISRSFQFLKPSGSSFNGVPMPPMPTRPMAALPSRRARQLQDEQKNWVFMNPDDLTALPKAEDILNVPEYHKGLLDRKSLTPVERFYQDLDDRNAAKDKKRGVFSETDDLQRMRDQFRKADEADAPDPNLPASIQEKESALKKLLGLDTGSFAPEPVRRSFSEVFSTGDSESTKAQELAHKEYINSFNTWLNRSTAQLPGSGIALPPGATDPTQRSTATTPVYGSSWGNFAPYNPSGRPANYDPTIGIANPTLAVTTPQDITTKVVNQWNPYYTPPKVQPPSYTPPAPVSYTPQRKFP